MTETIADAGGSAQQRLDRLRKLSAALVAPLAVHLVSDAGATITGQVFAVRGAEITLFSMPRPLATLYRPGGWDAASLADQLASLAPRFIPLEVTADVFRDEPRL